MDFGDILDEWERLTAKPQGGKKQLKKQAEQEQAAASRNHAGQTAPKPEQSSVKKEDPLSAWLRTHGVYDKDADAQATHETGQTLQNTAASRNHAGQTAPKPEQSLAKKGEQEKAASRNHAGQTAPKPEQSSVKKEDPLSAWLRTHGVYDKDADAQTIVMYENGADAGKRRRRLFRKEPDALIDLHGLTQVEAWNALESFFENSRRQGFEKLYIVHGKGNHSSGDAVLKQLVRRFIERCPFAGESGYGNAASGGSGATWVILKREGTC